MCFICFSSILAVVYCPKLLMYCQQQSWIWYLEFNKRHCHIVYACFDFLLRNWKKPNKKSVRKKVIYDEIKVKKITLTKRLAQTMIWECFVYECVAHVANTNNTVSSKAKYKCLTVYWMIHGALKSHLEWRECTGIIDFVCVSKARKSGAKLDERKVQSKPTNRHYCCFYYFKQSVSVLILLNRRL